jgi:hypothetical protein
MGAPNRKTIAFAVGMALIAGLLAIVSRSTKPPQLPQDQEHRGLSSNETCTVCHEPGARWPLSSRHPPKDDCLQCHGAQL